MKPREFPELFVEDGTDRYYVRGELRQRPARFRTRVEGVVLGRIGGLLGRWLEQSPDSGGDVLIDMGYRLRGEPPTALGIPISVLGKATSHANPGDCWWIHGRPELTVELLRHDEPVELLEERVREYQACGVPLVWLVAPVARLVNVFRGGVAEPTLLDRTQTLVGDPELPGFSCSVADFFR